MIYAAAFILMGYLAGSILFARVSAALFHKDGVLSESKDGNPGAANAYLYGGPLCGGITLAGDVLKGLLPVYFYLHTVSGKASPLAIALVMVAPVVGHAFPIYYRFRGGKGIAVSFGCLLGLLPDWRPIVALAVTFLFFSLVVKIQPHFQRTVISFVLSAVWMVLLRVEPGILVGFILICFTVCVRMHMSKETREPMKVVFVWKH